MPLPTPPLADSVIFLAVYMFGSYSLLPERVDNAHTIDQIPAQ